MLSLSATENRLPVAGRAGCIEYPLCDSLSMTLVKALQKRSYGYPRTGKQVRYKKTRFRFDNMPRPNHGMQYHQLIEVHMLMGKAIKKEVANITKEDISAMSKEVRQYLFELIKS